MGVPPRSRIIAISFFSALVALAALPAAADEAPPPTPPDTARVRALPGYSGGNVPLRSFSGSAWVLEAGPADGPRVVLIHGIAQDAAHDWDELIPELARTRRVIAFDLPGFGRSSRPAAPYTPETYANFVDEILDARVDGKFDVVAHSMGVSVALEVARRRPTQLRRLVLVDGAALLHGQALSLERIDRQKEGLGPFGGLVDGVRNAAFDLMGGVPDDFAHRVAVSMPGESAAKAAAGVSAHDSNTGLDAVLAPTLVVWGKRDEIASPRGAWALASRIDYAHLEFIASAAHTPMLETPRRFNALTLGWLDGESVGNVIGPADTSSKRDAGCKKGKGTKRFRGSYRRIVIDDCNDVEMEGVRAQEIELISSTVVGRDVVVKGKSTGLSMHRSRFHLSGGSFDAPTPMRMLGSEVDFAGVEFVGKEVAVEASGTAKLLCSLCSMEAGGERGHLHGFYKLKQGWNLSPAVVRR